MELHVWPDEFGLLSFDYECLQFMVAAKLCAAPVKIRHSVKMWESLSGSFPYFVDAQGGQEERRITDFVEFVDFLRNSKQDVVLDNDLIPTQLCEFDAYNALLIQKLRPALLHLLWLDRYNYSAITQHWFGSKMPFPYNFSYAETRRRQVEAQVGVIKKSASQLILDAMQVINLLAAKLGDNKYFCGDKPCAFDALVFGYLPLLKVPMPNDRLQLHLSSFPNLVRFVESIINIYLILPEETLREQSTSKKMWMKRKVEAQKRMEDSNIRREQKKTERSQSKEVPIRDTILFAVGAITLSVLFAAHTGIIPIVKVEKRQKGKNALT